MFDTEYEAELDATFEGLCLRSLKAAILEASLGDIKKEELRHFHDIRQALAWFDGISGAIEPLRFIDCVEEGYSARQIGMMMELIKRAKIRVRWD